MFFWRVGEERGEGGKREGRRTRKKESEKRENKGKRRENTRGKERGERKRREERAGGRPSNPPKAIEKTSMTHSRKLKVLSAGSLGTVQERIIIEILKAKFTIELGA